MSTVSRPVPSESYVNFIRSLYRPHRPSQPDKIVGEAREGKTLGVRIGDYIADDADAFYAAVRAAREGPVGTRVRIDELIFEHIQGHRVILREADGVTCTEVFPVVEHKTFLDAHF